MHVKQFDSQRCQARRCEGHIRSWLSSWSVEGNYSLLSQIIFSSRPSPFSRQLAYGTSASIFQGVHASDPICNASLQSIRASQSEPCMKHDFVEHQIFHLKSEANNNLCHQCRSYELHRNGAQGKRHGRRHSWFSMPKSMQTVSRGVEASSSSTAAWPDPDTLMALKPGRREQVTVLPS